MTEHKPGEPQGHQSSVDTKPTPSTAASRVWESEEWSSSPEPWNAPPSSQDQWDDGTEWPSPSTQSPEFSAQPDPVSHPVTETETAVEHVSESVAPSPPEDSIEDAVASAAEPETISAESDPSETWPTDAEDAVQTESAPRTPPPPNEDPKGDAFVVDGIRNDSTWGQSDQDWQEVSWAESQEPQASASVATKSVSEEPKTTDSAQEIATPISQFSEFTKPSGYSQGHQPSWISALEGTRGYVTVFVFALLVYGVLFGQRLGQVSSDPHYVFLADALLHGRWFLDRAPRHPITQHAMDNDWAYVDQILVSRLDGKPLPQLTLLRGQWQGKHANRQVFATLKHRWVVYHQDVRYNRRHYFVSFPPLPAFLMMPAVWLVGKMGYDRLRYSDITFSLFFAALAVLLLFVLLQRLSQSGKSPRNLYENLQLTLLFAVGSVFFFVATQGTVWFTALTVGACCSFAFLIAAEDTRHPLLAGIFVGMAFLCRPLLLLLSLFFFWQLIRPKNQWVSPFSGEPFRKLVLFALPVTITLLGMMLWNQHRFGNPLEFGHSYLPAVFWRVEKYGLFHPHWLSRNLYAFFFALPEYKNVLGAFDFSRYPQLVMRELPLIPVFLIPVLAGLQKIAIPLLTALAGTTLWRGWQLRHETHRRDPVFLWLAGTFLFLLSMFWALRMLPFPRINAHGLSLFITTPALLYLFFDRHRHPWFWGVVLTIAAILLPQLLYQNTGWLTFGNRFSLDYMPLLIVLLALSGITFGRLWKTLLVCAIAINTFGAISFGRAWYLYNTDFNSLDWIFRTFSW